MILNVLTHPNDSLRKKSSAISAEEILNVEFQGFLDDLAETMKEQDGAGLAAPQVGKHQRAVAVETEKGVRFFINPKIILKSIFKNVMEEGCLSVPGVFGEVKRPKTIWIKFQDRQGKWRKEKGDNYLSRVLQHEIDHLDGVLFIDKVIKKK
jgi:peptide deformylase